MARKIFGAFYPVEEKREVDFKDVQAVAIEMRKCAKAEVTVLYSEEPGFFVGGHAEQHNFPEINIHKSNSGLNFVVEQPQVTAEGLIRVTLALPKGHKLIGLRSEGITVEYNIDGIELHSLNLANTKGKINVKCKAQNIGLFSKYYPVEASIELNGRALLQVGSCIGDVSVKLTNASTVNIKRKPEDADCVLCKTKTCETGYPVDVYLPETDCGKVIIK